ncbi:hypothetical protein L218DRAFT_945772 [Marasmius fiardii PR-910]|nr:hypothetical protein L218DRAFT_945772 [Marasmius fiardii PR-910]
MSLPPPGSLGSPNSSHPPPPYAHMTLPLPRGTSGGSGSGHGHGAQLPPILYGGDSDRGERNPNERERERERLPQIQTWAPPGPGTYSHGQGAQHSILSPGEREGKERDSSQYRRRRRSGSGKVVLSESRSEAQLNGRARSPGGVKEEVDVQEMKGGKFSKRKREDGDDGEVERGVNGRDLRSPKARKEEEFERVKVEVSEIREERRDERSEVNDSKVGVKSPPEEEEEDEKANGDAVAVGEDRSEDGEGSIPPPLSMLSFVNLLAPPVYIYVIWLYVSVHQSANLRAKVLIRRRKTDYRPRRTAGDGQKPGPNWELNPGPLATEGMFPIPKARIILLDHWADT